MRLSEVATNKKQQQILLSTRGFFKTLGKLESEEMQTI